MLEIGSTDGVTVVAHDLGGAGPQLLVAHATGFHARAYGPMAEALGADFHVWSADLRGHGDATPPADGDFAWEGFADDVLAVVERLDLTGSVAFGHSKGGAALVLAELRRPGTFRALYLYEPIIFPPMESPPQGNPLAASARRRREVFDSHEQAIENFASKPPLSSLRADALEAYVRHGFRPRPEGGVEIKCRGEHEARTYEMSGSHQAFGRLGEVACPVTVAGSGDGGMPALIASSVAAALPHGRLERFDALGHFGPFEDPDLVAGAVVRAFRS